MPLKISIITPSLNQGCYIRDTIDSVLAQNYENVEHIIIDGGSTDGTLNILSYPHLIWISEKDTGPAEAITKGFTMATGQILGWLNADDFYEQNIFADIVHIFVNYPEREIICGNMKILNENNELIYYNDHNSDYNLEDLTKHNSDIIRQPSTFFRKELFYQVGGFDRSLKLIFDYDLFMKMFRVCSPYLVDKNFAYQRIYDATLTRKHLRRQGVEIFKVSRRYGASIFDKINLGALKRLLFPSLYTNEKSLAVRIIRYMKREGMQIR